MRCEFERARCQHASTRSEPSATPPFSRPNTALSSFRWTHLPPSPALAPPSRGNITSSTSAILCDIIGTPWTSAPTWTRPLFRQQYTSFGHRRFGFRPRDESGTSPLPVHLPSPHPCPLLQIAPAAVSPRRWFRTVCYTCGRSESLFPSVFSSVWRFRERIRCRGPLCFVG